MWSPSSGQCNREGLFLFSFAMNSSRPLFANLGLRQGHRQWRSPGRFIFSFQLAFPAILRHYFSITVPAIRKRTCSASLAYPSAPTDAVATGPFASYARTHTHGIDAEHQAAGILLMELFNPSMRNLQDTAACMHSAQLNETSPSGYTHTRRRSTFQRRPWLGVVKDGCCSRSRVDYAQRRT